MTEPFLYKKEGDLMQYGYIYMTINLINDKKYIGRRHQKIAKGDGSYLGSSKELNDDIKLYGKENFKKFIIVEGNYNAVLLGELEKHYIQLYGAAKKPEYYNISTGGDYDLSCAMAASKESISIKIYEFDSTGNIVNEYPSIVEASRQLNLAESTVHRCLKHKQKCYKTNTYFNTTPVFEMDEINNSATYHVYDKDGNYYKSFLKRKGCADFIGVTPQYLNIIISQKISFNSLWSVRRYKEDKISTKSRGRKVIISNYKDTIVFNLVKDCAKYFAKLYNIQGNLSSHIIRALKTTNVYRNYTIHYYEEEEYK